MNIIIIVIMCFKLRLTDPSFGSSFAVRVIQTESTLQYPHPPHMHTHNTHTRTCMHTHARTHAHTHTHTHTHKDLKGPPLVVWCTPGGGEPLVLTLLEHSYCMLEGQLEVNMAKVEVEQTTSVYQSSHSTLPTLLGRREEEHTCMGLSIRPEEVMIIAHFIQSTITMSHVQCVILQHEKLL